MQGTERKVYRLYSVKTVLIKINFTMNKKELTPEQEQELKEAMDIPAQSKNVSLEDLVKTKMRRQACEPKEQTAIDEQTELTEPTQQVQPPNIDKESLQSQTAIPTNLNAQLKRISSKQRKASLDEYRELYMKTPKIADRQPVFVSREIRDRIDDIVRRLGERKMSVSGFLENLAKHHLDTYAEDLDQWKRL